MTRALLEAARRVAFFGVTDLSELREAVAAADESDRASGIKIIHVLDEEEEDEDDEEADEEAEANICCAECREEFTIHSRIVTAKDGGRFHARCWRNDHV